MTGEGPETGLGGHVASLVETCLNLCSDSGLGHKKGTWGEVETGLGQGGERGLNREKDLSLGKEDGVCLTPEIMTGMEEKPSLDGESGMDKEMEAGQSGGGQIGDRPVASPDRKMNEEGETINRGGAEAPTSLSTSQEVEVVMEEEEEQSGTKEEGVGMDTSDADSLLCEEELTHRC